MLFYLLLTKIISGKDKSLHELFYRINVELILVDLTKIVQGPGVSIKIYALSFKTLITMCTTMSKNALC